MCRHAFIATTVKEVTVHCIASTLLVTLGLAGVSGALRAQTFVQITDLGQGIGPRLTSSVTQSQLGQRLFWEVSDQATFIKSTASNTAVVQFATDGDWHRLLYARNNNADIRQLAGFPWAPSYLASPAGIDVTASGRVYVADYLHGRVVYSQYDETLDTLGVYGGSLQSPTLGGVVVS